MGTHFHFLPSGNEPMLPWTALYLLSPPHCRSIANRSLIAVTQPRCLDRLVVKAGIWYRVQILIWAYPEQLASETWKPENLKTCKHCFRSMGMDHISVLQTREEEQKTFIYRPESWWLATLRCCRQSIESKRIELQIITPLQCFTLPGALSRSHILAF